MSTTAKRLVAGSVLTAAASAYYTAPANTRTVIKSAVVTNTTVAAVQATVHLVPNAGTASAATAAINGRSIAPNESYTCPELVNQVIEAGATLQALGLGLTLIVSGVEVV